VLVSFDERDTMYVLDTSTLFSRHVPDGPCAITRLVLDEVQDERSHEFVASHLNAGTIEVVDPAQESMEHVRTEVRRSGDELSETDISVIALAYERGGTICTDDYGIQNVAERMHVSWLSTKTEGIRQVVTWKKRCPGCGRVYPSTSDTVCEVCGTPLKRVRSKKGS
jgi:UPF0271 protein